MSTMCQSMGQAICELKHMPLSGDKDLDNQIKKWVKWDRNQETLSQIMEAVRNEDWDTLKCRLCHRIPWGTSGLRAVMRGGFDSMNELVVIQTTQGFCKYLMEKFPEEDDWKQRGVVVGYDGRYNSQRFADLTTIVFLSQNFRVYQFKRLVATPLVAYTVLRLNCLGGVMITASHNPKQDNGYKVYGSNGVQVSSPDDDEINEAILSSLQPNPDSWDETLLCGNELLSDPYNNILPAYYDGLKREMSCPLMEGNGRCPLTFTYTPLHGVGFPYIKLAFSKINLNPVVPVVAQLAPDPEFPTVPIPNPEDSTTLQMAIDRAMEKKTQVIIANDPDADRLAVAELDDNKKFQILDGNEVGALLGWWALENYKLTEENPDIANCVMISSTVSSKILRSIARSEGFTHHETLTGFKWIAKKASEEQEAGKKVLFGFEEAIGYMIGTNVLDKDGIRAAAHVATMACYLRCKKCMTMQEKLRDLYETFGFHACTRTCLMCPDRGLADAIFTRLRTFDEGQENTYPTSVDDEFEIENVRDLTTGYDSSTGDKKAILPVNENIQMITFYFKNDMEITFRTSGTEPKIKCYGDISSKPENKHWDEMATTINKVFNAAISEFLQPEKNCLERMDK